MIHIRKIPSRSRKDFSYAFADVRALLSPCTVPEIRIEVRSRRRSARGSLTS